METERNNHTHDESNTINIHLQSYTDKLNNTLMRVSSFFRELEYRHHNSQLMKRRRLLQKRQVVNHAKVQHKRRRQREIESQKAAIKEFFKM